MRRVRSGQVLRTGASVPEKLGCITLPVHGCVHPPGSSLNPLLWGIYGGFLIGTIHCQLHLQPFCPVWKMQGELNIPCFWWKLGLSGDQEPSGSLPRVTSVKQEMPNALTTWKCAGETHTRTHERAHTHSPQVRKGHLSAQGSVPLTQTHTNRHTHTDTALPPLPPPLPLFYFYSKQLGSLVSRLLPTTFFLKKKSY